MVRALDYYGPRGTGFESARDNLVFFLKQESLLQVYKWVPAISLKCKSDHNLDHHCAVAAFRNVI